MFLVACKGGEFPQISVFKGDKPDVLPGLYGMWNILDDGGGSGIRTHGQDKPVT